MPAGFRIVTISGEGVGMVVCQGWNRIDACRRTGGGNRANAHAGSPSWLQCRSTSGPGGHIFYTVCLCGCTIRPLLVCDGRRCGCQDRGAYFYTVYLCGYTIRPLRVWWTCFWRTWAPDLAMSVLIPIPNSHEAQGRQSRPEQSERVHDQDSPTSRTAAEQEGQSLAVDVEQGRVRCGGDGELAVEKEEGSDCELAEEERDLERRAAGDAAPSSEQSRSSAGDEAEQQQHEERIEILGIDSDSNSDSSGEVCRVCQQHSEEPLITLGCACRGGLARAHRSCIDAWFARKGSNKCEICQEVAANVPAPATQPEQFWIWRVGARRNGRRSTVRFQPLWAALMILIAGLLFDILISIFLGASALPVNIIIGILIVLGVGTVFRLMLECWRTRQIRRLQRTHMRQNPIYQGSNPTEHADDVPQEDVVQHVVQLQRPYQVHAIVVSSHRTVTV